VRIHLPMLIAGMSGAAFHGVIRLAYALDSQEAHRVSSGLAYLAASFAVLGPLEFGPVRSDDPGNLFDELAREAHWKAVSRRRTIMDQMIHVASDPAFSRIVSSLEIGEGTSRRLASIALAIYASTDDFTALHGVMGLEALSKLRPYVDDVVRFDQLSFQALTAAYLSIGAPAAKSPDYFGELVASTAFDSATVKAKAAMSDDAHVAKIVFTSMRLHKASGDPLYEAVAARAVENDRTSRDEIETDVEC
jgi:hypothetical protein